MTPCRIVTVQPLAGMAAPPRNWLLRPAFFGGWRFIDLLLRGSDQTKTDSPWEHVCLAALLVFPTSGSECRSLHPDADRASAGSSRIRLRAAKLASTPRLTPRA